MGNKPRETRKYGDELCLAPAERSVFGATVTLGEQISGDTRTLALTGQTALNAIRLACTTADDLSGDWKVLAISTPPTVFRDMRGARIEIGEKRSGASSVMPEYQYLMRVGRGDLLDPSVRKSDS